MLIARLAPPAATTPPGTPAPTPEDARDGGPSTRTVLLAAGGVAAAGLAAVAGAKLLHRGSRPPVPVPTPAPPAPVRPVELVEGVRVSSNPEVPEKVRDRVVWAVPTTGGMWGTPATGGRVSMEHVDQGKLGDCYDVAVMGAIADRMPERIERMVREVGDHVVVDLPGGRVAVTKELPLIDGSPAFAGSKADDPVYWPAYVEKAQAATRAGGYPDIDRGAAGDAFRQLLGSSPRWAPLGGSPAAALAQLERTGQPLVVSTHQDAAFTGAVERRAKELNVHSNHVYAVRRAEGSGDAARFELFNPWGTQHPKQPIGVADLRLLFNDATTPTEWRSFG